MKIIMAYFNDVLVGSGHDVFYGSPRVGKSNLMGKPGINRFLNSGNTIRVFTCKADTTDISRLPSQSVSTLSKAIKENCQFKIKFKS